MNDKTLALKRKTHVLQIYCGDEIRFGLIYTEIYDVTKLKMIGDGWYDIYNNERKVGRVSNVKEVTRVG
jgi:hypothetical protein